LEKEFSPEFMATDIVNLGKYNIYLKLMIDGLTGRSFSAQTLPPIVRLESSNREKIIKVSRERYGTQRQIVEDKISRWTGATEERVASLPQKEPLLYDAQCASCKKWTKVVFKPDGRRPVYCKTCLKNVQREKEQPQSLPPQSQSPLSLEEAMTKEPVPFSSRRDKPKKAPEIERVKEVIKEALKPKNEDS